LFLLVQCFSKQINLFTSIEVVLLVHCFSKQINLFTGSMKARHELRAQTPPRSGNRQPAAWANIQAALGMTVFLRGPAGLVCLWVCSTILDILDDAEFRGDAIKDADGEDRARRLCKRLEEGTE